MNDIDPFDEMEHGHERMIFIIRLIIFIIRQVIAGAMVIGGIIFMVWFWLLSAKTP